MDGSYNREQIMDKQWLMEEISKGKVFRYHAFLKGPLSNWRLSEFTIDGIYYKHTEQYYMAHKALFFNDFESYNKIMETDNPKIAKRLGRNDRIVNFYAHLWDRQKYEVMLRGNLEKYQQNPHFARFLIRTGDRVLVECNPYDFEWSCGLSLEDENVNNPLLWPGKSLLGFVLMEVRERLYR